jgi:hypothetical protein
MCAAALSRVSTSSIDYRKEHDKNLNMEKGGGTKRARVTRGSRRNPGQGKGKHCVSTNRYIFIIIYNTIVPVNV